MDPIRMMKVAPRPRTSGIIAAWLIRTKLPKVRKLGLIAVMIAQSRMKTIKGAQDARRQRRGLFAGSAATSFGDVDVSTAIVFPTFARDHANATLRPANLRRGLSAKEARARS